MVRSKTASAFARFAMVKGILRIPECLWEKFAVHRIGTQQIDQRFLAAQKPNFYGMSREHRNQRLLFERVKIRIAPGEYRTIRHIHQTHGFARMGLAGRHQRAGHCRW